MVMRRVIVGGMALALLAAAPAGLARADEGQAARSAPKLEPDQAELMRVGELLRTGDYEAALTALDRLVETPAFKGYPLDFQRQMHGARASLALQLGRYPEGLAAARRATSIEGAGETEWLIRVGAANAAQDWDDTARSLITLIGYGEDALDPLGHEYVSRVAGYYARRGSGGDALQSRLIDTLFEAGWDEEASGLWALRAFRLVDEGDPERAAAYLRSIDGASSRLTLAIDGRMDGLRAVVPEAFEVEAALARELEEAGVKAAADDPSLEDGYMYALALMQRGRFDEALTVVDAALARAEAAAAKAGGAPIDPDDLIWALDTRSRILVFLGRHDEAVAALRRAARRPENGAMNVSHAINLGALYNRIDRPADALDAVIDMDETNVSPFGLMQAAQVRACAYAALDRQAEVKTTRAWIAAHADDDPAALANVAGCVDDQDAAAADLIARLDDPEQRASALAGLQDYIDPPHPTASDARLLAFADAVRARPDVQAAIERAGHVRAWPVIGPQF
jgi:tetratricopeptide (TPR) repeat protein